ncbi:MAG: hypothetical protein E7057_10945 [Lentisphaerae bacterium]|nr:hypothetical protein [Lentisphaerota bacterium]
MALLAKFIRMRTARSHPRGARTRALNVPRRASTNIGNRAFLYCFSGSQKTRNSPDKFRQIYLRRTE